MLLPLALFFIGLFSIDQYRSVLVRAEFDALERQGMTLARSLALAEADRTERKVATRELVAANHASSATACGVWLATSCPCFSASRPADGRYIPARRPLSHDPY
jgi:hypothetical protein